MKYRVRWLVGKGWWSVTYDTEADAQSRVDTLLARGFRYQSKAGVVTFYPSHRISKIVVRRVPVKALTRA